MFRTIRIGRVPLRQTAVLLAVAMLLALAGTHTVPAQITFTKIVAEGDPVPDAPERTFLVPGGDYARPALDGETVVFAAQESGRSYDPLWAASISNGGIIRLVDRETPIPDGEGTTFLDLPRSTIHGGSVIFHGFSGDRRQAGLYSIPAEGEEVTVLENQRTTIPGGMGTFATPGRHFDLDGDNVVFDYNSHVYTVPTTGGAVTSIDNNTEICDQGDLMDSFGLPNISGETVALLVWSGGGTAIYTVPLGGLVGREERCGARVRPRIAQATRIASPRVAVPDDDRNFRFINGYSGADMGIGPLIDGDTVVFFGDTADADGGNYLAGLYSYSQGQLTKLVDTNTSVPPGGDGTFRFPSVYYSLSGDRVVFYGADASGRDGLYHVAATGGPITKIIVRDERLDDQHTRIRFNAAPIQARSLSGNQVAFRVNFLDADQQSRTGIYVATIEDPE